MRFVSTTTPLLLCSLHAFAFAFAPIAHRRDFVSCAAIPAAHIPIGDEGDSSGPLLPPDTKISTQSDDTNLFLDYINAIRPTTCIQAVGALLVGYLALVSDQYARLQSPIVLSAALSVYLSYGAGMVMNDVVDVDYDSKHTSKSDRAIASGRISKTAAWAYCTILCFVSLALGQGIGLQYNLWTLSNLAVMLGYALGLQRKLLLKNFLCAFLAISPLIGASILTTLGGSAASGHVTSSTALSKLIRLAAVGFPMHFSREILKDIEDMETDRGNKATLPLVIGGRSAQRVAFGIVGCVCCVMIFTPLYWPMFASRYPIYPSSVAIGLPLCFWASFLPLSEGQRLLKRSIYVLLAGMIGGLLAQ
uniref:Uncharacterized protein n=1 Tax=Minutocellus polymorphus TaxID=265543 RepID=A0A7S0FGW2_9STRA|mmetsp:Transcript_10287/g.17011  ORF Transcript_10287/g.17011 Transcript_10287/m.17011 type:complete len:362 (+) Transcript_10287:30-1115(+)|eukprot:CAMPEP_0197726396 /NCGR_PEP_ID=MMETSP1434-20131217/15306_1 /TAXON_ID=265543 /ORGANISM="Minutocellus polymorphus, Strain CCMP3303" /LENGTH=361 /DNA_ID=CAMNT_0043312313 /DNA_START=23 /DNA_END=1108 /DNA_ORIENTATION=+